MASLTIKGIPPDLMARLRELADSERRSLNQQAIVLLEQALATRPRFSEVYETFLEQSDLSPLTGEELEGMRATEMGRPVEI